MVSAWRTDTKDRLPADTITVFCSSAGCSLFSCFSLFIVILFLFGNNPSCHLQDQPAFDKKQFVTFMKHYIKNLTAKLDVEQMFLGTLRLPPSTSLAGSRTFSCKFYVPFYHHFALVDVMFTQKIHSKNVYSENLNLYYYKEFC
jgi:hypothetical protein